ncbi:hypothetical protein GCM10023340_36300 [Nocardioides marinquilinus]|uniref:Uncharacterized protein n=1 Tax=Nocardioides marinquilinus TaxID=1210400 RepID=A0ABP9PXG3_9ACTN
MSAAMHAPWCKNHIFDTDGVFGWCNAEFNSPLVGEVILTNGTQDGRAAIAVCVEEGVDLDVLFIDAALDLAIMLMQAAGAARREVQQ